MTGKVIRELEAWRLSDGDDERRERIEAIRSYLNPDPAEAADPDREAMAKAAAFLETDPTEAERIVREHFAAPEPKALAPLPFGEPEPAPVLWHATGERAAAVLSVGEVAVLSAPGGTGKSTLTLQVALAAAKAMTGRRRHWAAYGEACGLRVRPGPVVFVSYEDSPVRMAARARSIAGRDPDPAGILHWPDPGPLYRGFEGGREQGPGDNWAPLWAAVRAMDPAPSMVVIDPASAALDGVSMNEGGPVRAFMGALAGEAKAAGCGVLVVAHDTKASRDAVQGGDAPGAGAVAGSATWFDTPRGVLHLSRAKDDDGARELRCIKANYGRSGWAVNLDERIEGGRFAGFEPAPHTGLSAKAGLYASLNFHGAELG